MQINGNSLIKSGESADDLQLDNLMIIQKQSGYKFSTDSVLLANFARTSKNDIYVDFCTGSGVVAILVNEKNHPKRCIGVEIQSEVADMARRSVSLNNLDIEIFNESISETPAHLGAESVDVITVNPPYNTAGKTSENDEIALSTHEILTNFDEIAFFSSKLLKYGGKLFLVHRADRLADIIFSLKKNKLEPKVLRIVYPKRDRGPNLILIEAKKGAKPGIKILGNLILMNDDGTETDELKRIYSRKS